jgi:phage head maturation protease
MTTHLVHVDPDGAVFRGLAVPFGENALLVEKDGRPVAEQFDEESIVAMPKDVPLLVSHNRGVPAAGIINSSGISRYGLAVEGRFIGSDAEIEGWRRKLAAGLMAQLSIGFTAGGPQEWRRPQRYGGPPVVVRRNVEIVEVSLVQWAAYSSAAVVSINARTAASDESRRIINEMQVFLADTRTFLASLGKG